MASTLGWPHLLHFRLAWLVLSLVAALTACGGGETERPLMPERVVPSQPGGTQPNLLVNASFEQPVEAGAMPVAAGNWRGDPAAVVGTEMGIVPRAGTTMLKFVATGAGASLETTTGQLWQVLDLSGQAASIESGAVAWACFSGWFNRIEDPLADRRFDLRIIAFDGTPAEL